MKLNRNRLFVVNLVIWSGLALWTGCVVRDPELKLPCGLTGLRWGLSEAEFKTVRPRAVWNDSLEAYHEDIDTCLPFVEDAGYKFSRRRLWWRTTLESVSLGRELN